MNKQSQHIQELLIKYRENRCNREEYEELITLAQRAGNDKLIKEIMAQDWESFRADESEIKVLSAIPHKPLKSRPLNRRTILKVAAAIVILIAAGIGIFQWMTPDQLVFATGNGEVKEIILPDGSEVTLNANSHLTWLPARNRYEDREVKLTGEAFFHVSKEQTPQDGKMVHIGFQVRTPQMIVHVLGTTFNVSARKENTEVYLQEGSVEVQLQDKERDEVVRRLEPGDKVILDNQTRELAQKKSEDLNTSASWVTGVLNYHDKTLEEVLQNLSELFGVEIICQDAALQSRNINLGVPYMDWDNTRRALEMAIEVALRKEGDHYVVVSKSETQLIKEK